MQYFLSFLEGIITFISPCLLPMLPVYLMYFAGGGERSTMATVRNALGFVAGFTVVFALMGALAGALGGFVARYQTVFNVIMGVLVIIFGLCYLGVIRINIFKGTKANMDTNNLKFFSSMIFGMVFSVGWTPCVGPILSSALALASTQGSAASGTVMLFCYSLGLGIPFVASAVIIDKLKTTFDFIKRHYKAVNIISGILLIIMGIAIASGVMTRFIM
ncbi:MAG: sulfite exporter TauE/SafE family protein [Clostridia bacterium]|nr:sulfite exporter TauE/SafE family protein [Clostridia bacterium]